MSGRRRSRAASTILRVIPADLWSDPRLAAFLAECGLSPGDDRNGLLTNAQIERRWYEEDERVHAEARARTAQLSDILAGGEIRALYLLPRKLWIGREQFFFNWLHMWPSRYCRYAPTTEAGARHLGTYAYSVEHVYRHVNLATAVLDELVVDQACLLDRIRAVDPLQAVTCDEAVLHACITEIGEIRARHRARIDALVAELEADLGARWAADASAPVGPRELDRA